MDPEPPAARPPDAASDDDGEECYYDDADDQEMDSDGVATDADDEAGLSEEDAPPPEPPVECWAIKKEALSSAQHQDLSMVMALFNIKKHHARALLIHHRWNRDRICDELDRKGEDRMLAEAGIVLPANGMLPARGKRAPVTRQQRRVTCNVCFEDFSLRSVSTMDCGHTFCNDCWAGYFAAAVDGGHKQIRCMAVRCPAVCDEAVVERLLGRDDPAAAGRFREFLLRSYVDDNDAARWCPSAPHCGRAIRVAAREVEPLCEVECPCGVGFCFRCAAAAHSPCPCAMWERWEAKGRGESENVKWILANTKSCPKCFKPIVKDGGCNHVRCKCGQCMCWLCGGATGSAHSWSSIEGHSCNRFMEEEKKKVDDARRHVRRYAHYYERFNIHADSYKAEHGTLGRAISERAKLLESGPFRGLSRDSGWLADAHRSLLRCRQVLSRSYVFAYFMFDGDETTPAPARQQPEAAEETEERGTSVIGSIISTSMAQKQNLFESHQELLEGNVERLSRLLSTDFPSLPEEEVVQARREAAALVGTVETHCGKMYGCIQDELLPLLVEPMPIVAYQPGGPSKAVDGLPA